MLKEDELTAIFPENPRAEFVWYTPLWIQPAIIPLSRKDRSDILQKVVDQINVNIDKDNDYLSDFMIKRWGLKKLQWPQEPDSLAQRLDCAMSADVETEIFYKSISKIINIKYRDIKITQKYSRVIIFDIGMAVFEFSINISAVDRNIWQCFLLDKQIWLSIRDRILRICGEGENNIDIFKKGEYISNILKNTVSDDYKFNQLDKIISSSPSIYSKRISVTTFSIVIFTNKLERIDRSAARNFVSILANYLDGHSRNESWTVDIDHKTSEGNLEILSNGFVPLALVSGESESDDDKSPSSRLKSIWRQGLINYNSLLISIEGLREQVANSINIGSKIFSSDPNMDASENYDTIRKAVAGISLIRHASSQACFKADDFEEIVYKGIYNSWDIGVLDEAVSRIIDDADRANLRLHEVVTQRREKRIDSVLIILTLLTVISVIQDASQFIGFDTEEKIELGILFRIPTFLTLILLLTFLGRQLGIWRRR